MALFSDLKELKQEWKESSPAKKGLIILVLFLTTSSLTSLSDTVFKWKGFILEGMEFYRASISSPLLELFSYMNLKLTEQLADFLIVYSLSVSGFLRLVLKEMQNSSVNQTRLHYAITIIANLTAIFILYGPAFLLIYLIKSTNWNIAFIYSVPIGFMGFLTLGAFLSHKRNSQENNNPLLIVWGPVIVGFTIVLILAAINSGLSKPL